MTDERHVAELAAALGVELPAERLAGIAAALDAQIAGGGGMSAAELEGVEPATVFRPDWSER
jgi:hypothetical protein